MILRLASMGALAIALAACGDEPVSQPVDDAGRTAEGRVLGGTISDAMIPLDRLRSQAPPLVEPPEGEEGAAPGGAAAGSESAATGAESAGEGAEQVSDPPPEAPADAPDGA